jgi:hypothetical protein
MAYLDGRADFLAFAGPGMSARIGLVGGPSTPAPKQVSPEEE